MRAASPIARPDTNPTLLRIGSSGPASVLAKRTLLAKSPPGLSISISHIVASPDSAVRTKSRSHRRARSGLIAPRISSNLPIGSASDAKTSLAERSSSNPNSPRAASGESAIAAATPEAISGSAFMISG